MPKTKYEELIDKMTELDKKLDTCHGAECKLIEDKILELKTSIPVIDRDELISDIVDKIKEEGIGTGDPIEPEIKCPSCGGKLEGDEKACPHCNVEIEWTD